MDEHEKKNGESPRPVKDRFPRIVILIVLAEFCERFSYSSMRAFLTIYLKSKLGYSDDGATEIYHIFSTLVYLFPIFGGILADNYLGKFRTILYMMFVYVAGNALVAVTAVPQLSLPGRLCTLLGLFMITIGTGGIKPCVTAFAGDQFIMPEQEKHLAVYFCVLYFTLCTGSLIAKTVSPILRSEVSCFGDKDCYSLAFGAPGFVIIVGLILFVSAKRRYVMKDPEGNVVFDFVKCVSLGLKNLVLKRRKANSHWLDTTEDKFDKKFIRDVKQTLSILTLFTVLPVFWSLLDQLGSRWTLQATKMDGNFGFLSIKPDQMQVLVPTFILILIPISQKYAYPFLESRGILKNPLHKLTVGGVLAGVAFIASATVEIYLKSTYPQLPSPGHSQLRIFNGYSCSVTLHNENFTYTVPPLQHYSMNNICVDKGKEKNMIFDLEGSCIESTTQTFILEDDAAISFYLANYSVVRYVDDIDKSRSGLPVVRFLVSQNLLNSSLTLYNERRREVETVIDVGVSSLQQVFSSNYTIRSNDIVVTSNIVMQSGGVFTIVIDKVGDDYRSEVTIVTAPNSITMAWLLPQLLIISIAEVLFGITGIEFAFKESPESMKAVMSAVWLLTEAVGNVIIIIVSRIFVYYSKETQFFIFTGMMFSSVSIFYWMSRGYQLTGYGETKEDRPKDARSNSVALYQQVKQIDDCLDP